MILVDYSPVLISCAHSAVSFDKKRQAKIDKGMPIDPIEANIKVEEVHMFRMLNTLRMVNTQNRRRFGHMVLCVDRKPYWRNDVFPNYKKNRKPMDRSMDWKMFFDNGETILNAARDVFGWQIIDVPGIEADDAIGVLVHQFNEQPQMVISPDGDYKQLQIYPSVSQYDTIRNRKIIEKYPEVWLRNKIVTGDKKDGIPNIMSHIDTFMTEGVRQNSITNANKKSWSQAASPMFFCDQEMLERYEFNKSMLSMADVPAEQTDLILNEFKKGSNAPGNLYGFFAENGLSRFIDQLGDFK